MNGLLSGRYIKSEDYTGPDMTDFGRRSLIDEEFNASYQEDCKNFATYFK